MTPADDAPWQEHRMLAEAISQAFGDAATRISGKSVDVRKPASFNPELVLTGRPVPLRAVVVRFQRPLRDVAILISSLGDSVLTPLADAGATAALAALDVNPGEDSHGPVGTFTIDDVVEYETLEIALEQVDALYLEASYELDLPNGDVQLVLGTGLLEAANCHVNGMADPFAEGPPVKLVGADDEDEEIELLGSSGDIATTSSDEPIDADDIEAMIAAATIGTPASASPSPIDALDAELAASEQATAKANIAAAEAAPALDTANADHWQSLLSGVEVELSAELGRADLELGQITSLNSESVLTLDQLVSDPVDVYVNGTLYARARLVVVDGEYGIEIIDVVDQNELVDSLAA